MLENLNSILRMEDGEFVNLDVCCASGPGRRRRTRSVADDIEKGNEIDSVNESECKGELERS